MRLERPDIGACYCKSGAPDGCVWDPDARSWVGPCCDTPNTIDVERCVDPTCAYPRLPHYHPVAEEGR